MRLRKERARPVGCLFAGRRLGMALATAGLLALSLTSAVAASPANAASRAGPLAAAPANAATKALPPSVRLADLTTGLCLDAWNWGIGVGSRATQIKCGESGHWNTQHWLITHFPGYVKIKVGFDTAWCLNAVVGTGGVTIKRCRSNDLNQNWIRTNVATFQRFENSANAECLDGSLQFGVRVAPCIPTDKHQLWAPS